METKEDEEFDTHQQTVSWSQHLHSQQEVLPCMQVTLVHKDSHLANCLVVFHVAGDLVSTRKAAESLKPLYPVVQIRSAMLRVDSEHLDSAQAELGVRQIKRCLAEVRDGVRIHHAHNAALLQALDDCAMVCETPAMQREVGQDVYLLRCFSHKEKQSLSEYVQHVMSRFDAASRTFNPPASRPSLSPILYKARTGTPSLALISYANCDLAADDCTLLQQLLDMALAKSLNATRAPKDSSRRASVAELAAAGNNQSAVVYESQALEGMRLLTAVERCLLRASENAFHRFKEVRCRIVVPNLNSLYQQTAKRVDSLLLGNSTTVMKAASTIANTQELNDVCSDIQAHPECLYIIIQDECHWGLTAKGFVNVCIHKQLMESSQQNNNVVHICVSATPENHFVINALQGDNIVKWDINKQNAICRAWEQISTAAASKYYGEKTRPEEVNIRADDTTRCERMLTYVAEVYDAQLNRKLQQIKVAAPAVPSLALMLDYLASFIEVHRSSGAARCPTQLSMFSSVSTQEALRECTTSDVNGQGKLCVVRMSCHTNLCKKFLEWLRAIRDSFGLETTCSVTLCAGTKTLYDQLESHFRRVMGEWRGGQSKLTPNLSFGDLVHLPGIFILVDKGRMGDTFPSTMSHFDLRACYSGEIIRSTFIQDAGRTFRMATSTAALPKLLLRPTAHEAFKGDEYHTPDHTLTWTPRGGNDSSDEDQDEENEAKLENGLKLGQVCVIDEPITSEDLGSIQI